MNEKKTWNEEQLTIIFEMSKIYEWLGFGELIPYFSSFLILILLDMWVVI